MELELKRKSMNKLEYLSELELINREIKRQEKLKKILLDFYIDKNKPCNIDDEVQITLSSGRKVSGTAKTFGILKDKMVHITSYKEGSNMKYITEPTEDVKVI